MLKPLRRIETTLPELFLTFDDGPCPQMTPGILQLLKDLEVKATFFVIGAQAQKFPKIVEEILKNGHTLGNHSLDHKFAHFFCNKDHLKQWIVDGEDLIYQKFGVKTEAFRSPAGVVTPPLTQAIQELEIPWVHWNTRFFDTSFPLRATSWTYNPSKGDILLLHDRQRDWFRPLFLDSLKEFIVKIKDKGFDFRELKKEKF